MGAYFLVVNPVKRQHLDPVRFGEGIKFQSVLCGGYCLHALKLLISDCFGGNTTSFRGAWLGDPVILASDDSGVPNPGGFVTATADDPARNLNRWASEEFTNISYWALAVLCGDNEVATDLATSAKKNSSLMIDLCAVVEQYQVKSLQHALEEAVGYPWRKAYSQALAESAWWHPLPPVDSPL